MARREKNEIETLAQLMMKSQQSDVMGWLRGSMGEEGKNATRRRKLLREKTFDDRRRPTFFHLTLGRYVPSSPL